MRSTILILSFTLLCVMSASGQADVLNQFYINLPKQNPAFAGVDDFTQVNLQFSQPWNSLSSDAANYSLSIFSPLGHSKALDDIKRGSRISAPVKLNQMEQLPSLRRRHGVGLSIDNNQLGPSKEIDIAAYYAYHLPVSKSINVSLGVSSALYNQRISLSNLTVRNPTDDLFYQNLIQSSGNSTRLLTNLGLAVYSRKLYLSVGAFSVIDELLQNDALINNFSRETSYRTLLGWKLDLSPKFSTHVTGVLSYSDLYDFGYKSALRLVINNTSYIGGAYHQDYKYSFILGFNANRTIYINYAYDRYLNFLRDFVNGTHNLTLSIQLFNTFNKSPLSW